MKRSLSILKYLLPVFILLFAFHGVASQTGNEDYIALHTEEELSALFSKVKSYLDGNGEKILPALDETENSIITQAFIRSWAITQYKDASPQQIDDAYEALFNMSLFLGLAADPQESFSSGMLFEYAVQLLDQEYFDLLAASGEDPENIDYAEYLRGVAEGIVETPEAFSPEEVQDYLFEIYQETYLAAGLKSMAHTNALPLPEELFPAESQQAMIPNPMVEYYSAAPLNEMLGIKMPELTENFGGKLGYYSIIADILAEIEYEFPNGGKLILRLTPESDVDISGVYGYEFYEDWEIAGTKVEVDKYQSMLIAHGILRTMDGKAFGFAAVAEGLTEQQFRDIVVYFIEGCVNQ